MIERFLPWLKEFKPEAYNQYRYNYDGDYEIADPWIYPGGRDRFFEVDIDGIAVLVFMSARGDQEEPEFSEWNDNNKSWQYISDEDVPDELLALLVYPES